MIHAHIIVNVLTCVHSRLQIHVLDMVVISVGGIEEKLDAVLKLLDALKQEHKYGQEDLRQTIDKLEKDVTSGQEEAGQAP